MNDAYAWSLINASRAYAKRLGKEALQHQQRGECFMCTWSDRFYEGVNVDKVIRLFEIADENNVMCDKREVALQLHLYFKDEVYQSDQGMSMLTKEIALEHIECHRPKLVEFK